VPNFSSTPLGKLLSLNELNFDDVDPSLWEIMNIVVGKPTLGEEMTPEMMQDVHSMLKS
jgi:hypothetical protein